MMESMVKLQRVGQAVRQRRGELRVCPHCRGNVRVVRDIYGAYHQCIQCSRDIEPAMATQAHHMTGEHLMPGSAEELLAA